jgi:hypothetical protein
MGDHPQEELAKFGYRSQRKVIFFKNLALFWQPAGNYCLNNGDFGKTNSLKSDDFGHIFFPQNSFA